MLASLAVGVFLLKYRRYKRFDGELILWFLLLHEGLKAALESFRVPYIREIQLVSIDVAVLAALALIACYAINSRSNRSMKVAPQ
jgi:NhaP-type Na+/H+ and K+/H+ antiporter